MHSNTSDKWTQTDLLKSDKSSEYSRDNDSNQRRKSSERDRNQHTSDRHSSRNDRRSNYDERSRHKDSKSSRKRTRSPPALISIKNDGKRRKYSEKPEQRCRSSDNKKDMDLRQTLLRKKTLETTAEQVKPKTGDDMRRSSTFGDSNKPHLHTDKEREQLHVNEVVSVTSDSDIEIVVIDENSTKESASLAAPISVKIETAGKSISKDVKKDKSTDTRQSKSATESKKKPSAATQSIDPEPAKPTENFASIKKIKDVVHLKGECSETRSTMVPHELADSATSVNVVEPVEKLDAKRRGVNDETDEISARNVATVVEPSVATQQDSSSETLPKVISKPDSEQEEKPTNKSIDKNDEKSASESPEIGLVKEVTTILPLPTKLKIKITEKTIDAEKKVAKKIKNSSTHSNFSANKSNFKAEKALTDGSKRSTPLNIKETKPNQDNKKHYSSSLDKEKQESKPSSNGFNIELNHEKVATAKLKKLKSKNDEIKITSTVLPESVSGIAKTPDSASSICKVDTSIKQSTSKVVTRKSPRKPIRKQIMNLNSSDGTLEPLTKVIKTTESLQTANTSQTSIEAAANHEVKKEVIDPKAAEDLNGPPIAEVKQPIAEVKPPIAEVKPEENKSAGERKEIEEQKIVTQSEEKQSPAELSTSDLIDDANDKHSIPAGDANVSADSVGTSKENSLNHSQENFKEWKRNHTTYMKEVEDDGTVVITLHRSKKKHHKRKRDDK